MINIEKNEEDLDMSNTHMFSEVSYEDLYEKIKNGVAEKIKEGLQLDFPKFFVQVSDSLVTNRVLWESPLFSTRLAEELRQMMDKEAGGKIVVAFGSCSQFGCGYYGFIVSRRRLNIFERLKLMSIPDSVKDGTGVICPSFTVN